MSYATATAHAPERRARWVESPARAFSEAVLTRRLLGSPFQPGLWGWLIPLFTAAIGGILRFYRLGEPDSLVFDETYYVKDAYSYLLSGYEREWPEDANDAFNAGSPGQPLNEPEYVVHPPVGKWMIAFGMALFGSDNAFGWRFGAALVGTLSILLIALIAQSLFKSTALGGIAGLLTAIDGHHLVHSRTSLLDIFLAFWVVAAFGALLLDRYDGRRRLAGKVAALARGGGTPRDSELLFGPLVLWRPWRLAAAVCLGLAVGTKWSALAFVAAFGLMAVLWDMNARRVAGIRQWFGAGVLRDGVPAFFTMIPLAALTYVATWTGWFLSADGYHRQWARDNAGGIWGWVPDPLRSLAEYHRSAYTFHSGLDSSHPYESTPWTWLFMGRPTSFYYQGDERGVNGCLVENCSTAVTVVGNAIIWWGAALALSAVVFAWLGRRDWRAGAILSGIAAGYLVWFLFPERTMFYFYAIAFQPFLILALTYVLGLVLGRSSDPPWRRRQGVLIVGLFVVAALLVAAFFLPVWTAEQIPYQDWRWRMWMPSWV
nr:phospholipid carrier-dependent glycosyltransferase [Arthrobacter crystallopoietes]